MGLSLELALRYMRSKKRAFVSVGTMFAVLGVALGVGALATVISVTGGFRASFQEKVNGVNAHVLILKYSSDFREYQKIIDQVKTIPGIIGIEPFVINPMMVTHGDRTATGVLLKGVDPNRVGEVMDLPQQLVEGSLQGLRLPGAKPPERRRKPSFDDALPSPKTAGSAESAERPFGSLLRDLDKEWAAEAETEPEAPSAKPKAAEQNLFNKLPEGAITPQGGFASELPDEDVLPVGFDPDPCKDADARAKLPGIAIGATLRRNLEANLGDCLQVTSPTIGFSYAKGAIRAPIAKRFRVVAIFDAGFDQYDSKFVFTDLYEAQAFSDSGDTVTGIEMKVADIHNAREIARKIDHALASGLYHTTDWEELNYGLFTALRIQQLLMSLVLALIIVVAAFTVIATLIMVVLEKKREIAVLKAMGASDATLLRAFLYHGALIGGVGTGLGLLLGYGLCRFLTTHSLPLDPKVYFISKVPVLMQPLNFVWVGVFAMLVCVIATLWPALHAARLRPAEAFRD